METHYNSTEGAHDEAVETSAERIILVLSRNSNSESSSDYSYDAETSRSEEWKFDDVDCRSSSSLGASSPSCVEDSEPDMEIEISFLQEKQSLLKRALDAMKREDAYEASMARNIIDGKLEREKSPLWKEARDIVENLKQSEDTESLGNIDSRSDYMDDASDFSPLKKQKIDTSSVVCVSSGALIDGYVEKEFTGEGSSMTLAMTGSWMGQALAQTITCSLLGTPLPPLSCINGWEMVDDPSLGAIVVPPPLCCLQNGVELKDAVALTSDPQ